MALHVSVPKLALDDNWPGFRLSFLVYAEALGFRSMLDPSAATPGALNEQGFGLTDKAVNCLIIKSIDHEYVAELGLLGWDLSYTAAQTWTLLDSLMRCKAHTEDEHTRTRETAGRVFTSHKTASSVQNFLLEFNEEWKKVSTINPHHNLGLLWFYGMELGMTGRGNIHWDNLYSTTKQGHSCEACDLYHTPDIQDRMDEMMDWEMSRRD